MDRVNFVVPGSPQGKGRPILVRSRAGGVRAITPPKTRGYEAMVMYHARLAMQGQAPYAGACALDVVAYLPIPASWPKWKRDHARLDFLQPTGKPDADNALKIVADACNGIVWRDDAQVVEARIIKRYSDTPRVEVSIVHLEAKDRGVKIIKTEAA